MTPFEVETKVKALLAEKLDIDQQKVTLDSRLIDDLGMDSFASIEIVFELEEVFSIKVSDKDMAKAVFVRDIVDYISAQKK
jgi:acyl carrier protein